MSFFRHSRAMPIPFGRAVTLSALFAATLVGSTHFANPLLAQTAAAPPSVTDATDAKAESVEQRITSLHDKLLITADEEVSWAGVAQVMRENSAAIEKLVVGKKAQGPDNMTALDDLMTYQAFAQAHLDGLKKLSSAFGTLYNSMPAAQKAVADEVFHNFGRAGSPRKG